MLARDVKAWALVGVGLCVYLLSDFSRTRLDWTGLGWIVLGFGAGTQTGMDCD